jgi:hypothetical protein
MERHLHRPPSVRRLKPPHLPLPTPGDRPVGQFRGPAKPEPVGQFRGIHDAHYNTLARPTACDGAMAQWRTMPEGGDTESPGQAR